MVPASFNLLGHTVTVRVIEDVDWPYADDEVGMYESHRHRINIRGGMSESMTAHTFHHELLHACLTAMSHPLNDDEAQLDMLAGLIHQALSTSKFK